MKVPNNSVLKTLYEFAPGPRVAEMCVASMASYNNNLVGHPKLDAQAMKGLYEVNRTPVDQAVRLIKACCSPDVLSDAARRERRAHVVSAVIENRFTPLDAVLDAVERVREKHWTLSHRDIHRSVVLAVGSHSDTHGSRATAEMLVGCLERDELKWDVPGWMGWIKGLCQDPELVRWLIDVAPDCLYKIVGRPGQVPHADVIGECLSDPVLARHLCMSREALEQYPNLAVEVFDRHKANFEKVGWFEAGNLKDLMEVLCERPLGAERLEWLWKRGEKHIHFYLVRNPQLPVGVLESAVVDGSEVVRARVLARLLSERVGDDPNAFSLAAGLVEDFKGTYGQLCDTVAATLQ